MADVVNLRLHRKRKQRTDREEEAARNRAVYGRSASEKAAATAQNMLERRRLEAGRIERCETDKDRKR